MIQGAEELARNYDVDGVHLDDYFYPGRGFADGARLCQQYGGAFQQHRRPAPGQCQPAGFRALGERHPRH
ncbi:MAG: hypothetical protein ACLRWQ_08180 [Flavonifractor plautii]